MQNFSHRNSFLFVISPRIKEGAPTCSKSLHEWKKVHQHAQNLLRKKNSLILIKLAYFSLCFPALLCLTVFLVLLCDRVQYREICYTSNLLCTSVIFLKLVLFNNSNEFTNFKIKIKHLPWILPIHSLYVVADLTTLSSLAIGVCP